MKKFILLASLILGGTFSEMHAQGVVENLNLQVGIIKEGTIQGERPRNPVNPPSACLDDHTLYINSEHSDYTLYIVDTTGEEPDVVYQVCVPANVYVVILPATLNGTYELQLYDGSQYYYYSEIVL